MTKHADPIAPFTGFPKQSLAFLAALGMNNEKAWFDAHRDDYQRLLVEPAKSFVVDMGRAIARFAPKVHAEPKVNGSISRINRDIRFSADKSPYKTHLDLWFWEGAKRGFDLSGFYFRLEPAALVLGAGIYQFEEAVLERYREAVQSPSKGKALEKAAAQVTAAGCELGGERSKRVPRGLSPDQPRAELLKHKGLYAGLTLKVPRELSSARLVDLCAAHYRTMLPLHRWLAGLVSA
jgi:uncharacterized protein (TIGR02453 family)